MDGKSLTARGTLQSLIDSNLNIGVALAIHSPRKPNARLHTANPLAFFARSSRRSAYPPEMAPCSRIKARWPRAANGQIANSIPKLNGLRGCRVCGEIAHHRPVKAYIGRGIARGSQ
jgi:hypothetical protein